MTCWAGFEPMDGMVEILTERAIAALAHWNLPQQVPELIKYRENAVFKVRLAWGEPAALRLHRPAYHSQAALTSELAFMANLRDRGLAVPQPIPAANGALLLAFGEEPHYADLIGWVDGEPLGETGVPLVEVGRDVPAIFRAIGREMGLLHGTADAFRQPVGFERPAWDAAGLLGEAPFWGRFWDCPALPAEDRAYLTDLRETLSARLAAVATSLDYGLIHADIVRENIFVRKGAVAFIDFDDCGFGFRLFDLATTLLRNRREPNYPAFRSALLEGYAAVRPQARASFEHLPLFLLLRALTYIGWAAARPELADNADRLRRYVADVRALAEDVSR
jgi:Ser/Thr protein kinase RdoA (MazF antagonist)